MNKVKLMIVMEYELYPVGGGLEKSLANVLNVIDCSKFEVTLVTVGYKIHDMYLNKIQDTINVVYLTSHCLGAYKPKYKLRKPRVIYKFAKKILASRRLLQQIEKIKPDIILDYEPFFAIKTFMRSKAEFHGKLLLWHHNSCDNLLNDFINRYSDRFHSNMLDLVDGIIFPSNISREELKNYLSTSASNMRLMDSLYTIYNGMDFAEIDAKASICSPPINAPYILMVSRFHHGVKDHETLIKAFKILLEKFPNYKLVFCGDGDDIGRVSAMSLVNDLDIVSKVIFVGRTDNPYVYMENCNVFVLSSYREGLPVVINEAMYLGKPIVVSNITSCMEAINFGACGLSFKAGDSQDLAGKLNMILSGDYNVGGMLINQRKFIDNFNNNNVILNLQDVLCEVLDKE